MPVAIIVPAAGLRFPCFLSMKIPIRPLTIEDFNSIGRFHWNSVASLIRLKGCWLKVTGFQAGDKVEAKYINLGGSRRARLFPRFRLVLLFHGHPTTRCRAYRTKLDGAS